MKKIKILFVFLLLISCKSNVVKYAEKKSKDFNPEIELSDPIFIEKYNKILYPVLKNYIERNSKKYQIVLNAGYGSSISFSGGIKDNGIVNYEIREINSVNKKFRKLFPQDIVVINREQFKSGYDDENNILSFMSFVIIENDTNDNSIFDEENDIKQLYIYIYKSDKLVKISNDSLSVNEYSLRFLKIGKDNSAENYYIYFTGKNKENVEMQYLFSFIDMKLELLNDKFTENYTD